MLPLARRRVERREDPATLSVRSIERPAGEGEVTTAGEGEAATGTAAAVSSAFGTALVAPSAGCASAAEAIAGSSLILFAKHPFHRVGA